MTKLLLDTNVVSALRAPHRQAIVFQQWLRCTDSHAFMISSLTWMEIATGVLKMRRSDPVQGALLADWFERIQVEFRSRTIAFDADIALVAAPLWLLRSRGSIDVLIAGTALAYDLSLATRNVRDFDDIPGLTVVDPWQD